jgi:hypothetical protein
MLQMFRMSAAQKKKKSSKAQMNGKCIELNVLSLREGVKGVVHVWLSGKGSVIKKRTRKNCIVRPLERSRNCAAQISDGGRAMASDKR